MTYYPARDLANSMRTVRKNTLTMAEEIPEEKYSFRPTPETRSVAELLRHIVSMTRFAYRIHAVEKRQTMEGFDFMKFWGGLISEEAALQAKPQILDALRREGAEWAAFVESLPEERLADRIKFNPPLPEKSRFEMLLSQKEHEMHHRGQLMLIERMLGMVPHLTREFQARMAQAATARS